MTRSVWHLLVDVVLFGSGLLLLATGLLLEWVLPAPGRGATVWGWSRHDWGGLHFWSAVAVLSVLLVHLGLNWGWVCSVASKLLGAGKATGRRRAAWGAAVVVAVVLGLAGFLWLAGMAKQGGGERARGDHAAAAR